VIDAEPGNGQNSTMVIYCFEDSLVEDPRYSTRTNELVTHTRRIFSHGQDNPAAKNLSGVQSIF
jgi:hypothetical protein